MDFVTKKITFDFNCLDKILFINEIMYAATNFQVVEEILAHACEAVIKNALSLQRSKWW